MTQRTKPMLQGIRIIEIEGLGPGPFAAMHLADLGADVITIHRKGGGSITADQSVLDRGKRSIALDLKDPDDLVVAKKLIDSADALIEGFRPGVMERLGLGPADCHATNPRLVYGRMTGWGQTGPRAETAGHDLNYIAQSGALWYASEPGSPPITPATLVGDIGGGALYLVIGILTGILNAQEIGQGTVVDAAIVDGSAHMMTLLMALRQAGGLARWNAATASWTARTGLAAMSAPMVATSPYKRWSHNSTPPSSTNLDWLTTPNLPSNTTGPSGPNSPPA